MQRNVKTSVILIVAVGIFLFFAINRWMSGEISKPATEPTDKSAPAETAVAETRPLNITLPSIQTEAQEPTESQTVQNKEKAEHIEPVYEPPSNSVILVQ